MTPDYSADFNLFCGPITLENLEVVVELLLQASDKSIGIIDVTDFEISDPAVCDLMILAICSAGFVVCDTAKTQERIYELAGRLAPIIESPLAPESLTEPDDLTVANFKKPTILWFGTKNEVFSVKTYEKAYGLTTAFPSTYRRKNAFARKIESADFIFLPKTYTVEDEFARQLKVESMVKLGKLVVAPALETDFEGLAIDSDLPAFLDEVQNCTVVLATSHIVNAQKALLKKYSIEASKDQLMFALREAPKDEFNSQLENYLDAEGVQ